MAPVCAFLVALFPVGPFLVASPVETWLDRAACFFKAARLSVSMALTSALSFPHWNFAFWRLLGFGVLAAGLLMIASPLRAEDSKDAVQSAVGNDQIQRDRPLAERARETVGEVQKEPDIQHEPPQPRPVDPPPVRSGPLNLAWLPYAILAVIGIGLAYLLLRYIGNRYAGRKSADAKAAAPAATSTVLAAAEPERDRTFDEIDALAESGAFTEAVHRLLLLVQERLRSRIEHGLQASLTSREILRRAKLPQDAATAFATLVAAVEVSLFGMRSANAATYTLCREHSRRVLAAAAE